MRSRLFNLALKFMKKKKVQKVLKKVFGAKLIEKQKIQEQVREECDHATCEYRLIGIHKASGVRSIFGCFPTSMAAEIYRNLLQRTMKEVIKFEVI